MRAVKIRAVGFSRCALGCSTIQTQPRDHLCRDPCRLAFPRERRRAGKKADEPVRIPAFASPIHDDVAGQGAVNHLGILVQDLDKAEQRVLEHGIKTHSHQTYDPGSRFYFHDHDGIEYEVVSYA